MSFANKIRGLKEIWLFDNHWYLALTRLVFPGERVSVYRFRGLEILVDRDGGDINGTREILATDMYSQFLSLMDLPETINVLDLGAQSGGFPLLLRALGKKLRSVCCVELNPNTFSRLKFNLDRNFPETRRVALNLGVCDSSATLTVALGAGGTSDNIYDLAADKTATQTIQGTTFDDVYKSAFPDEMVDICKIDIEGAEFDVFRGHHWQMAARCRYILIEIHHNRERDRRVVIDSLVDKGFTEIGGELKKDDHHHVHFFANQTVAS
jgi:FkbM family methyltransferase